MVNEVQEVVMLVGMPGSGKSTTAARYHDYVVLNRDTLGGRVEDLLPRMEEALLSGRSIVLDNTFGTKESRLPFILAAKKHGVLIRCYWIDTSMEDCQYNVAERMIRIGGKLLSASEIKSAKHPNLFPASVLFSYQKKFCEPSLEEGFVSIERESFCRTYRPEDKNFALLLDYDGTLRRTKSGSNYPIDVEDIEILPGRSEKLTRYREQGYLLLGVSNQSGVGKGVVTEEVVRRCFDRTNQLLGHSIDYAYCPHGSFPITCYCRKPMSGSFVAFQLKYGLDPRKCIMVGDLKTDETFAKRSGIEFRWADEFFS